MLSPLLISTPASGLRSLTAEIVRTQGGTWAHARAAIAEASGVGYVML